MSRKSRLALAAIASALVLPVGGAVAHDTSFPTEVVIEDFSGDPSDLIVAGRLESDRRDCIEDRKVVLRIQEDPGDPFETVDEDRSSENGAFAVRGDFEDTANGKVKAKERDLRSGGEHDHVCEGDSAFTSG